MNFNKILIFLINLYLFENVFSYGEPNLKGFPAWHERSNLILVNAVRMAPKEYQHKYTNFADQDILSPSVYPPTTPVYFEFALGGSALSHATDMSLNGCFSHSSCDGTDCDTRINNYYQCSPIHAENIASGYDSPLITNNQWVCDDGSNDPYSTPNCAGDASGSDGHRSNIMNPDLQVIGIGYSFTQDSTYHSYWAQDFGQQSCFNLTTRTGGLLPIASGSHLFLESSKITFMVSWYDKVEPTTAYVVISGTPYKLKLDLGSKSKGIYSLTLPMVKSSSSSSPDTPSSIASKLLSLGGCRDYYFYFEKSVTIKNSNTTIVPTDKGNMTVTSFSFSTSTEIFRYPHFGYLTTFGESTCRKSYSLNGTEYNPYLNPTTLTTPSTTDSHDTISKTTTGTTITNPSGESTTTTSNNNNNSDFPIESTVTSTSTSSTSTSTSSITGTTLPSNEPSTSTTSTPTHQTNSNYNSFESSIETYNNNNKFIGCYNDEIIHDLPFNEIFSVNMTNEKCESYCSKNGYKYSGTELGTQCYCGNKFGLYGKSTKQSDCNFKCGGDKSEICGGNDKISIYKTSYNGCYAYEPVIGHFSKSAISPTMTVESCRAYCYRSDYLVAGLARGNLCFCGNDTIIDLSPVQGNCNIKCIGSNKEICGGESEISIYSTQNLHDLKVPNNFKDTSNTLNNIDPLENSDNSSTSSAPSSIISTISLYLLSSLLIVLLTF